MDERPKHMISNHRTSTRQQIEIYELDLVITWI